VDLAMPVMAIFGAKDALVPVAVAAAMQQLAPNVMIKIIDKAGHAPFLSHPNEVVALMTNFIEHHV